MSTFRSLHQANYKLWATGALVSNIGTWMQRIAQDWLVLTELTQQNATAVGIVVGLQFGPQMLLQPLTGWVADHYGPRFSLLVAALASLLAAYLARPTKLIKADKFQAGPDGI